MKLIVGLGNPGDKYQGTRHNVGFDVIDALARQEGLKLTDQKFRSDYTIWRVGDEKVLLVKPYTFMNLSGEAVLPLMSYYNISPDELVVVYDDLDLEPGKLRLRQSGSAGGHNGVKSIIEMLGTQDFKRVKIGIGRPQCSTTFRYRWPRFNRTENWPDNRLVNGLGQGRDFRPINEPI